MGLRIDNRVAAAAPQRHVEQTTRSMLESLHRLASAKRINSAADDAAGLAIAERLRSEVAQANRESENLQYGISATQTADAGLEVQGDAVQRLRELALQASNGTLSPDQRASLNAEAQGLLQAIDETARSTEFNGTRLLDGSQTAVPLGTESGVQLALTASTTASLGISGVDVSTVSGAQSAVAAIDSALEQVGANRALFGAQQNALESAIAIRESSALNAAEAESRIRDADVARLAIEQARNQVLLGAGIQAIRGSSLSHDVASRLLAQ